MTAPYQPKRSFLYTPASRIERVEKMLVKGAADIVVADLEDGTAPDDRPAAREALVRLLRDPPTSRSLLAVRINAWPSPACQSDLDAITTRAPPLIVVPKAESREALDVLADTLDDLGARSRLFVQIESARGLLEAGPLAAAPRVDALVFGAEDYRADVGATWSREGTEVLYARSHVVACAAAAGIEAIDQIWADYRDIAGLSSDAVAGRRLGYAGKQLIHPDQIQPTHEAFAPSAAELETARRIVEASAAARGGVAVVDGRMVDRPIVEQARRVLRRAQWPG